VSPSSPLLLSLVVPRRRFSFPCRLPLRRCHVNPTLALLFFIVALFFVFFGFGDDSSWRSNPRLCHRHHRLSLIFSFAFSAIVVAFAVVFQTRVDAERCLR